MKGITPTHQTVVLDVILLNIMAQLIPIILLLSFQQIVYRAIQKVPGLLQLLIMTGNTFRYTAANTVVNGTPAPTVIRKRLIIRFFHV
jgi:hypothetical protein